MSDSWVSGLIDQLDNAVVKGGVINWTDDSGQQIQTAITIQLVDLIRKNKDRLLRIGQKAFHEFLLLMMKQQDFDALVVVYNQLDNSDIIDAYKEDSIKLAEIAKQTQDDRDFWIWFGKQVGTRIVFGAIGALI